MAGPLPQQLIRQAPLASRETFACLSVDKKRLLSPLCQGRELLTISSSFSIHQKELDKRSLIPPAAFIGEREALNLIL